MRSKQTFNFTKSKKKKNIELYTNISLPKNSIVIQPPSTPAFNQALYLAVLDGNLHRVDRFIKAGAQIDELAGDFSSVLRRNTFLYLAAYRGERAIVERLLSASKTTINTPNTEGFTPLHAACQEGHRDIVAVLSAAGAKTDATDDEGSTPLFVAVCGRQVAIVDVLLNTPQPLDKPDARGNTPLYAACQNGCILIVNKLLNAGANINLANKNGNTPLHIAAMKGCADIVNLLLSRGAAPSFRNTAGKTAHECLTRDNPEKLNSEQQELTAAALKGYKTFFHYWTKKVCLNYQLRCFDDNQIIAIQALQSIVNVFDTEQADQIVLNLKTKLTDVNDPHYAILTTALVNLRKQLLLAIKDYSDSKKRELYRTSAASDAISSSEKRLQLPFLHPKLKPEQIHAPSAPNMDCSSFQMGTP